MSLTKMETLSKMRALFLAGMGIGIQSQSGFIGIKQIRDAEIVAKNLFARIQGYNPDDADIEFVVGTVDEV